MPEAAALPAAWRRWLIPVVLVLGVAAAIGVSRVPPDWLSLVVYPPEERAAIENIHRYRDKPVCQACHPVGSRALLDDSIAICAGCHPLRPTPMAAGCDAARGITHLFGIEQTTPADVAPLRLGPNATVICHTCHDPHRIAFEGRALRLPTPELCERCHPGY